MSDRRERQRLDDTATIRVSMSQEARDKLLAVLMKHDLTEDEVTRTIRVAIEIAQQENTNNVTIMTTVKRPCGFTLRIEPPHMVEAILECDLLRKPTRKERL